MVLDQVKFSIFFFEKRMSSCASLVKACENGDAIAAKKAVDDGADVNRDYDVLYGCSPLLYTTSRGFLNVMKVLLKAGCDPNAESQSRITPLFSAVTLDRVEEVLLLLKAGADPNKPNCFTLDTPAHQADDPEILRLLVQFGADLQLKNLELRTPYQYVKSFKFFTNLRPIYEAWTPRKALPRWSTAEFHRYTEKCDGFRDAVFEVLLCLRRYRHILSKDTRLLIIGCIAEIHRREESWPAWVGFSLME